MENEETIGADNAENEQDESFFELTPDEATGFDNPALPETGEAPGQFNRKRVMITIAVVFSLVIGGGLLINTARSSKKTARAEAEVTAADTPSSFLSGLRDNAANRRQPQPAETPSEDDPKPDPEPALPPVSFNRSPEVESVRNYPPPQNSGAGTAQAPVAQDPDMSPVYRSPLVPPVEGSLFVAGFRQPPQSTTAQASGTNAANDYFQNALAAQQAARGAYGSQTSEYMQQNNQEDKQNFYDSSNSGGVAMNGRFLGENAVWTGTIVPGVLETAINTDLPGNVLARVTRNIYDSQTGQKLLIPQGTILIAKYNSSVSYAQHRVQIVWDTLIRPDGFQLDLEGMNSVDKSGMSGQQAIYHENWFEYLKAAGIITMFSLANARMTETAAQYATDSSAAAIAGSNSELVNQLGGNMVGRAMNIQPTLTVENGTLINVMLNKTLYLPPVDVFYSVGKYILE